MLRSRSLPSMYGKLGADAVVGVAINCSEIGSQGKAMLMVVATGTAVTLSPSVSTTH